MSRVKLSEYDAKRLFFPKQLVYSASISTSASALSKVFGKTPLVVKVDQGIKKRGKQGLVDVGVGATRAVVRIQEWSKKGWSQFLVEPVVEHKQEDESYLSFSRTRRGWQVMESKLGGVEIESNWDSVKEVSSVKHQALLAKLDELHISFLELNPVILNEDKLTALDCAAEIDSTALSLSSLSSYHLAPVVEKTLSTAETKIIELDASTPASLKFKLINPEGRIWMLLSGGGASLVLADEVADLGMRDELANYGEYSGAPSTDDTYAYTKTILTAILKSKHKQNQAIVIAGGVANFTDVASTFRGIILALDEVKSALVKSRVKVFVRRGGPNEEAGLKLMSDFLEGAVLLGSVHGSTTPLTRVIQEVKDYL